MERDQGLLALSAAIIAVDRLLEKVGDADHLRPDVGHRARWDCHGIPVEVEVEKKIGSKSKRDIEEFGVARFNELCRQSVKEYVEDWNRLTERIGFWIDLEAAYWTMDTSYIESVWWALKQLHDQGRLYAADKVTAYCPRCGTPLSDHEVAMGYAQAEDPSIYVRFPMLTGPLADEGADLASHAESLERLGRHHLCR